MSGGVFYLCLNSIRNEILATPPLPFGGPYDLRRSVISCHASVRLRWTDFVPGPFMSPNNVRSLSRTSTISAVPSFSSHGLLLFFRCYCHSFHLVASDRNENRRCFCLQIYDFPYFFNNKEFQYRLRQFKKFIRVRTQEQTQAQSCAQLRTYSESFITSKIFSNSAEHELKLIEYDLELSTKKVL